MMATLEERLPICLTSVDISQGAVGLVVVDAGVGFTREGLLSDPIHMIPMVHRIDAEWKR